MLALADHDRAAAESLDNVRQRVDSLEREGRSKTAMLSSLSWEVRAHLNGIMGSADLLLDSANTRHEREQLSALRSSAEALHQSLNDVIDYSRIESGRLEIARASFDIRQPLTEVIEQLQPLASRKGLELVLIIAPDVPVLVTGDAARLRQVLANLMANALKFTSSGRIVLRAELPHGYGSVSPEGATWLHFTVSDTGSGIPEEMQASLFDRITLAESEISPQSGRGGLSLVICRRLVELMGGKIGARSTSDGGTDFWVVLPLPADREQPVPIPDGEVHVVLLDELAVNRVAGSTLLTRLGIEHDPADTVEHAIELLREAQDEDEVTPILLVDESTAERNSPALGNALTAGHSGIVPRVVVMTRDAESPPKLSLHVDAFIAKPLLKEEALHKAITVARSGTGAPTPGAARQSAGPKPLVLVVDDDEISRFVNSQLLGRLGCNVELAKSGPEAIERARNSHFDLIVMDCQMPEMDGFEATEKIRAEAGDRAPPVIALTANITAENREHCFAAGMCDFIDKPVRRTELARVLKRWVPQASSGA